MLLQKGRDKPKPNLTKQKPYSESIEFALTQPAQRLTCPTCSMCFYFSHASVTSSSKNYLRIKVFTACQDYRSLIVRLEAFKNLYNLYLFVLSMNDSIPFCLGGLWFSIFKFLELSTSLFRRTRRVQGWMIIVKNGSWNIYHSTLTFSWKMNSPAWTQSPSSLIMIWKTWVSPVLGRESSSWPK